MQFIENTEFELPVVITRGFVLFPNDSGQLTVNREFTKKAIKDSKELFESYCVVVSQRDLDAQYINGFDDIYDVGTVGRVIAFTGSGSNGSNAKIIGTQRVKINSLELKEDTFYAKCELYPDVSGDQNEESALITNIIQTINKASLDLVFQAPTHVIHDELASGINALDLSYTFAAKINGDPRTKQKLLEATDVNVRLDQILIQANKLIAFKDLDQKIKKRVQENIDKQQKEYYLREQIKSIKTELGEDPSKKGDDVHTKLDKNPYPEAVKEKIKDELSRKELMPQGSLEASLIQDYIDIVLSVPWFESSQDNDDIENSKKILDEDHYGLQKVKERIIEYLSVKKIKGDLKAPILCFYGPPGCGKTSLSISIARALNRKFIKCSLGGVSDEAEIRGHRRTYVGSRPGRIINLLRKAKVNNPVFLLDEIDKLSHDNFKGDPGSALLEVLDPEQNTKFSDNYLELDYDLSNVLFICTANDISRIPGPLLDRLELINVPSYTSIDKLHIAKDFLIKRELIANGLPEGAVEFEDDAIFYIIDRYTKESGVRDLQRNVGQVIRKIIVKNIDTCKQEGFKYIVKEKEIPTFLGLEIFEALHKEKKAQVGVVTGLAYTDFGGDTLPIEVNYFKGKGNLIITGNLGNVMKESCSIALDYVKANADKYGISSTIFDENDIHIHFPEGAIPKDGPSAGCAITCAFISALSNKPVSANIAMTGEVNLRGNVIPIGGLREKSLAALRSGIKKILVPEGNRKTVEDLPNDITDNLKIVFMKNVDDAAKVLFN